MKTKLSKLCLALSSAIILSQTAHAVPTANGDLLIGFYQIIGGAVQSSTYIFNLGPAYLYRENTQSGVAVSVINPSLASSNIGADLSDAFGEDWAESGTVYWTICGGFDQTTSGVVNGDVLKTPYISIPVSSYVLGDSTTQPTGSTFGSQMNSNGRSAVSNQIQSINAGSNGTGTVLLPGGNARGAKIPASGILDTTVDSFFPPTSQNNLYLTLSTDLRGLFEIGTMAGSGEFEGALDVYRYVNSTTASGVDLSTGFGGSIPASNAGLGVGQYIGTFTIDALGEIKVYGVPPTTPGYTTWATTNGVTGQAANLDHDNDGVSNGVEYFLFGPSAVTTGFTALPGVNTVGSVRSVTWPKAASYTGIYSTHFVIETSTTLAANSWATETLGVNVIISGNNVTYTFPPGPVKAFARLKVTGP